MNGALESSKSTQLQAKACGADVSGLSRATWLVLPHRHLEGQGDGYINARRPHIVIPAFMFRPGTSVNHVPGTKHVRWDDDVG